MEYSILKMTFRPRLHTADTDRWALLFNQCSNVLGQSFQTLGTYCVPGNRKYKRNKNTALENTLLNTWKSGHDRRQTDPRIRHLTTIKRSFRDIFWFLNTISH